MVFLKTMILLACTENIEHDSNVQSRELLSWTNSSAYHRSVVFKVILGRELLAFFCVFIIIFLSCISNKSVMQLSRKHYSPILMEIFLCSQKHAFSFSGKDKSLQTPLLAKDTGTLATISELCTLLVFLLDVIPLVSQNIFYFS